MDISMSEPIHQPMQSSQLHTRPDLSSRPCSQTTEALHGATKVVVTTAVASKHVDPTRIEPSTAEYKLRAPRPLFSKKSLDRPKIVPEQAEDLNTAFIANDRQPLLTNIELNLETPVNRPPPSLDKILHKARDELSRRNILDSPVGSVGLQLSLRPPDTRSSVPVKLKAIEEVTADKMEDLLNQIDSITVTLQQQREVIARHERSMANYQSQLRQKELEVEDLKRSSASGSQPDKRRTLSEVAAEYQRLLQAEGSKTSSAGATFKPTVPPPPTTKPNPPDDRVQDALARLQQELRLQKEEIRRLSSHQGQSESGSD